MQGIEKIHLDDAYEDSPQTRSLLGVFEKDASLLHEYSSGMFQACKRIINAQKELCSATQSLSHQLKSYEHRKFPLESDGSVLAETLKQFSVYLDEVSSMHQILATQLADNMMYPVSKFLQADMEEIRTMADRMKQATQEHEQSLSRYMKVSKRKDSQKTLDDASEDLFVYRKKRHQTALHYYSSLNALQYKRKFCLIEPILGYMHAQRSFFTMSKDAVAKDEIDDFLSNINASCQAVRTEMGEETQKTVEKIETIEKQSKPLYYAEPSQEAPRIPPNPELSQKAGYLYMRSKKALITTSWDRSYFFIQGGNLMCQSREEVAGSLVLDLNEEATCAEPTETDDRRNVFSIVQPVNKKTPLNWLTQMGSDFTTVILQAESESDRDEWIMTINNVVKEGCLSKNTKELNLGQQPRKSSRSSSTGGEQKKTSEAVSIPSIKEPHRDAAGAANSTPVAPPTPPSTPAEGAFIPDAPISFDMISPSDETKHVSGDMEGPQKRINPFDESKTTMVAGNGGNAAFHEVFDVRFCGSMQVQTDRGEQLVLETIRQIMAARALHNIFKMTESHLLVSSEGFKVIDPSNHVVRAEFILQDVSFWAAHTENKRLFGFITRTRGNNAGDKATFTCHVFECNTSADEICHAMSTATKLGFQALMEKKAHERQKSNEQQILMDNIGELEDNTAQPQLSDDGSEQQPKET